MTDLEILAGELGLRHEVADLTGGAAALFSPDGAYRYALTRAWGDGRTVAWVMLNPSVADAFADDPTIRRCASFSRAAGYGGLVVLNLFALRATDPAEMRAHEEPVGPLNTEVLVRLADDQAGRVSAWIAAWGTHGTYRGRDRSVRDLLGVLGVNLYCLGVTKDGHPRHPLYVPSDTGFRRLGGERAA